MHAIRGTMENKKQYGAVDLFKYISALLVVAIHTYPLMEISPQANTYFINDVCRLAVPFFFVTSAFFFFSKVRRETMDQENRLYLYLRRLVTLYLAWTIVYIPYMIWNYAAAGVRWYTPLSWLRDFFLNGSYYHLWFLPALILGTVIVYRLWLLHSLKRAFIISLLLYLIGYMINIYGVLWQQMPYASVAYGIFEKVFVTARNGIFFAPIFVTIGLYLSKVRLIRKSFALLGFVISMVCLCLEVWLYQSMGLLTDLSCMYLSLVPATFFLVSLLLRMRIRWNPEYKVLRQESTLIYTSHILFARIFLMILPDAHLVVYFFTLAFSQMTAWLILRLRHRFVWLNYLC